MVLESNVNGSNRRRFSPEKKFEIVKEAIPFGIFMTISYSPYKFCFLENHE